MRQLAALTALALMLPHTTQAQVSRIENGAPVCIAHEDGEICHHYFSGAEITVPAAFDDLYEATVKATVSGSYSRNRYCMPSRSTRLQSRLQPAQRRLKRRSPCRKSNAKPFLTSSSKHGKRAVTGKRRIRFR